MALPIKEKTWQFNVNNIFGPYGTLLAQNQAALFFLKQALTSFATSPWVVAGSSDSATGGMDSVDRWVSPTNLVWANSGINATTFAHSWVVLKQPGLSNLQVLWNCASNGYGPPENAINLMVSPSGSFTGGSATARPTAADEDLLIQGGAGTGGGAWVYSNAGTGPSSTRFTGHVMQATDGSTRIFFCRGNTIDHHFFFERASGRVAGYDGLLWAKATSFDNAGSGSGYVLWSSTARARTVMKGSAQGVYYGGEGFLSSLLGQQFTVANELDGSWPLSAISIVSNTVGTRGRHGHLADMWWTSDGAALVDGDTFPGDGTNQFVKVRQFVYPWNGTIPLIS